MPDLTPKQRRFVAEYLVDLNATQAAIRAGYSAKTSYAQGQALLKKLEIAQAVREGQEKAAAKTERTSLDVLRDIQELGKMAREKGNIRDGLKALELEGKHLGMFRDKLEVSGFPAEVEARLQAVFLGKLEAVAVGRQGRLAVAVGRQGRLTDSDSSDMDSDSIDKDG
jgi:phage terminase small subunit